MSQLFASPNLFFGGSVTPISACLRVATFPVSPNSLLNSGGVFWLCWVFLLRWAPSCGAWAELLRGTWDPPGPGNEVVSPVLAGGLFTTEPQGSPHFLFS